MRINEIDSKTAFEILKFKNTSYLIDVRSKMEWDNFGVVDLSIIKKTPLKIEWPFEIDKNFLKIYNQKLTENFLFSDDLIFICRSGIRSRIAAKLSINFGYESVFNICDGFEGKDDGYSGWKSNNLPWHY